MQRPSSFPIGATMQSFSTTQQAAQLPDGAETRQRLGLCCWRGDRRFANRPEAGTGTGGTCARLLSQRMSAGTAFLACAQTAQCICSSVLTYHSTMHCFGMAAMVADVSICCLVYPCYTTMLRCRTAAMVADASQMLESKCAARSCGLCMS